jgi:hypothetical protein
MRLLLQLSLSWLLLQDYLTETVLLLEAILVSRFKGFAAKVVVE